MNTEDAIKKDKIAKIQILTHAIKILEAESHKNSMIPKPMLGDAKRVLLHLMTVYLIDLNDRYEENENGKS